MEEINNFFGGFKLCLKTINPPPPAPMFDKNFGFNVVKINEIPTPFAFRPDLYADNMVVNAIFNLKEYALPMEDFQPKLILDCGANIGCSAVYFANKYPEAQIYSVEPEINHRHLLKFNTVMYENIHVVESALWDKETFIRVEDKGFGDLAFMTFETTADDPEALKTVTVPKLLADSGFEEIDLLKIDIEGAEKEVFSADDVHDWLPKVKVLVIELHDRMKRGCSYEFFKAMSEYRWFFAFNGENQIFIRENLM